jgi:hypothetical protein
MVGHSRTALVGGRSRTSGRCVLFAIAPPHRVAANALHGRRRGHRITGTGVRDVRHIEPDHAGRGPVETGHGRPDHRDMVARTMGLDTSGRRTGEARPATTPRAPAASANTAAVLPVDPSTAPASAPSVEVPDHRPRSRAAGSCVRSRARSSARCPAQRDSATAYAPPSRSRPRLRPLDPGPRHRPRDCGNAGRSCETVGCPSRCRWPIRQPTSARPAAAADQALQPAGRPPAGASGRPPPHRRPRTGGRSARSRSDRASRPRHGWSSRESADGRAQRGQGRRSGPAIRAGTRPRRLNDGQRHGQRRHPAAPRRAAPATVRTRWRRSLPV